MSSGFIVAASETSSTLMYGVGFWPLIVEQHSLVEAEASPSDY